MQSCMVCGGQPRKNPGAPELYIIPGAVHTALYDDRAGVIPYDKMEEFFTQYLK